MSKFPNFARYKKEEKCSGVELETVFVVDSSNEFDVTVSRLLISSSEEELIFSVTGFLLNAESLIESATSTSFVSNPVGQNWSALVTSFGAIFYGNKIN